MKNKIIFKTSLFLLFVLLCRFSPKKENPSIINFTQRFMPVDKNLYADKYDVTVADYQLFLREKKQGREDYTLLMYDSTKWMDKLGRFMENVDYYFNYGSYADYPIVCISHYGA